MRTARLAVAPQERVFVRLDEHQRNGVILLEVLQKRRQLLELQTLARVHEQGGPSEVAFTDTMKFSKNRNEVDGQVVHAVETHVFEGMENGAFAGAGESGENDELARVLPRSRGGLHGQAAQLFTRR